MIFLMEMLKPLASRMCLKMTCIYKGKGENQSADANPPQRNSKAGLRRGQLSRTRAPYRKHLFIKVLQLRSLKVDVNV